MSEQGTFIIRKNGEEKSLCIVEDAYPSYSARNVISLIRDTDLGKVFDNLNPSEFSDRFWFDARELSELGKQDKLEYYKDNTDFIKDSMMCDYGYVINLDDEELEYYVGKQICAQKGNRYGEEVCYTSENGLNYYPCRLVARFSFRFIKNSLVRNIVGIMEKEYSEEIRYYDIDTERDNKDDLSEDMDLKPRLILITKKLDWIENRISTTLDKHIDMGKRYDQGLRDIEKLKAQMQVFKLEMLTLQNNMEEFGRKR